MIKTLTPRNIHRSEFGITISNLKRDLQGMYGRNKVRNAEIKNMYTILDLAEQSIRRRKINQLLIEKSLIEIVDRIKKLSQN